MAKYNIEIREVLTKIIPVEAKGEEQAKYIAIDSYRNAKNGWVLDADNCVERLLSIVSCKGDYKMFKLF